MRAAILLLTLSLLSACSILPESKPLDIYLLPASPLSSQSPGVPWSLRINSPTSEQLLDSTRIIVLPEAGRVNAYQGVRWSEHTPELLRNRLLDGFRDDARIAALSVDGQNLYADLELVSNLRRFYSQYENGQVMVYVQLDAQLIDARSRSILASRRFNISQASTDSAVSTVVNAFGLAADTLTRQLVDWTVETGNAAAKPRASARF